MSEDRRRLPQTDRTFLSDGGLETTLIFHEGAELPHFAAFLLLADDAGRRQLANYYRRYLDLARQHAVGFILDSPTWRANPDWGDKLGYTPRTLAAANEAGVHLMLELRREFETPETPCVVSGALGPRGDGYKSGRMSADEAQSYHAVQIASFAGAGADMVTAYTLNTEEEAIGVARAAAAIDLPCAVSFTVETDGRLVTGRTLRAAIEAVDAATRGSPAYYLVNCAHPTHFSGSFNETGEWRRRVLGLKANASTKSHQELDESETLDAGDPADFGARYAQLCVMLPWLRVFGGCCGTDHRHVAAICKACVGPPRSDEMRAREAR